MNGCFFMIFFWRSVRIAPYGANGGERVKQCIIPSSLKKYIKVILLIAQIMMILRNESMKILNMQFRHIYMS